VAKELEAEAPRWTLKPRMRRRRRTGRLATTSCATW